MVQPLENEDLVNFWKVKLVKIELRAYRTKNKIKTYNTQIVFKYLWMFIICLGILLLLLLFMQHSLHTAASLAYVLYIQLIGARVLSRNQGRPCGRSVAGSDVFMPLKHSEILKFLTNWWYGNE